MTPYYQHGKQTIYHGDCREIVPRLKYNLILTDPPYGTEKAGAFDGNAEALRLARWLSAHVVNVPAFIRCMAFTPGINMMWHYPKPDWILAHFFQTFGGMKNHWGFNWWTPILVYGADPYLQTGRGARPDALWCRDMADKTLTHPYPKPLQRWEWLLRRVSVDPTETVLDPFLGSGTTLVACQKNGQPGIGVEREERFCEEAANRLRQEMLF